MKTQPLSVKKSCPGKEEIEANWALCDAEYQRGVTSLESTPRIVTIETTSVCNIKCVMCSHGLDSEDIKYEHFPEEMVPKLSEALRSASIVQLHGIGEPLMNPAFWRMVELTHGNQHVVINSNGILLTKKNTDRILGTSIGEISFSMDAATKETYKKIRGADFGLVIENLRYVIEARRRLGRSRPLVYINMTMMRENIEEVVPFIELAHEIGVDGVQLGHMNSIDDKKEWLVERNGWTFDYKKQMLSNYPQLSNRMLRAAQKRAEELKVNLMIDWAKPAFFEEEGYGVNPANENGGSGGAPPDGPEENRAVDSFSPKDCNTPWSWMLINTNGAIFPCCFGSDTIGSLIYREPMEIWNQSVARSLRRHIIEDKIHPVCKNGFCKFIAGVNDADDKTWKAPGRIYFSAKEKVNSFYLSTKKIVRGGVGEKNWVRMREVYRGVKKTIIKLADSINSK